MRRVAEVDILVNNLGIYEPVGFFEETDAGWQRLFEVNIMSGVRLSRTTSRRCWRGTAAASCTSRASRRSRLRPRWRTARLVTEQFPGLSLDDAERRFMRDNRPTSLIERLIGPREIADLVAFVASPRASAINGGAANRRRPGPQRVLRPGATTDEVCQASPSATP